MKKLAVVIIIIAVLLILAIVLLGVYYTKNRNVPSVRPTMYFDESEIPSPPTMAMMQSPLVPPKRRAPIYKSSTNTAFSKSKNGEKKVKFAIKEYGPSYTL